MPELREHALHGFLDARLQAKIERDRDGPRTLTSDRCNRLFEHAGIEIGEREVESVTRKRIRDGGADAVGRTRDEGGAALNRRGFTHRTRLHMDHLR